MAADSDSTATLDRSRPAATKVARRTPAGHWTAAFRAILRRDAIELAQNLWQVIGNLIVPTVLLLVASAGFSGSFGRALGEPYDTYVTFAEYLVPGLAGLVLLFAVTRSVLALVNEPGAASMRLLSATPLPRWFLVFGKLASVSLLAAVQAALFIAISPVAGTNVDVIGWLLAVPATFAAALMIAAVVLALAVFVPKLRVLSSSLMFVVLPGFFVSSALYPLWKFTDYGADLLRIVALSNPFTHAIELIRFASERHLELVSLAVVVGIGIAGFAATVAGANSRRGPMVWGRRQSWATTPG